MKLVVFALSLILSVETFAFSMGDAINKAGRQRMLSQRITLSYILMGIQPDSERHQRVFERSMAEFNDNLNTLSEFEEAAVISPSLAKVIQEWARFNKIAQSPVSKSSATALFKSSNILLPAAHQYVVDLERLANHSSAELVSIAGRQRMLSQRMAKNYAADYWGLDQVDGLKLLYADLAEFEHMLNYLQQSGYNTHAISRNLSKTQGQLTYAVKGFDGKSSLSGKRLIHVITGTTDMMLRNMDVITKQYGELMDNLSVASR